MSIIENSREDMIRRRALALWTEAGQRGVVKDYWDSAARQIDEEYEEGDSEADRVSTPLIP